MGDRTVTSASSIPSISHPISVATPNRPTTNPHHPDNGIHSHRFPFPPFFFDFPPFAPVPESVFVVVAAAAAADSSTVAVVVGASAISTSPPTAGAVVALVPKSFTFAPAASFPSPVINRPTSAALFVLYFRQIPVGGWYVFSVSVAMGVNVVCVFESAVAAGSVTLGFDRGCDFSEREG